MALSDRVEQRVDESIKEDENIGRGSVMHSPTRVTHSNVASIDAVVTCARDLRALLERRVGRVDVCDVHVDGLDACTPRESFRIKLHVAAEPFDVQLTMAPHSDVYIALTQTFDRIAWLLPRLRQLSNPTLLRKLRTLAADALRKDTRRYRPHPPALPRDEVRLS